MTPPPGWTPAVGLGGSGSEVEQGLESSRGVKLTAYFGERSRAGRRLLADELMDVCASQDIRASILLRGVLGFGAKHRLRTDRLLTLSEDLPVAMVAVDERLERIQALHREVCRAVDIGMVTLERASLGWGELPAEAVKVTVYMGRHERVDGVPAFMAACQALHDRGVAGATVLLGVDGTRHGHRQRARFFARNAEVPTTILAVGEGKCMAQGLRALQAMLPSALLSVEQVRVCKRDGQLLERPNGEVTDGLLRLTVVTSEAARHEGRPVHLELTRRLRAARAAGATSLRGIWGFHGQHRPHGDRLLSLRRHVPIVTTVVDVPERIAGLFSIVDELTAERGLVTSEAVPANMALAARL